MDTHINHLKDIDIRKDSRTRAAWEKMRQEAEQTSDKEFWWVNPIENGNLKKLSVKELDLHLKQL